MNHAAQTSSRPQPGDHPRVGHVVPVGILVATLAALLFLTWITVAATRIDLGGAGNLWVAMIIATVKAALVVMYFMHLRYDRPFNAFAFVSSLAFVALFICLAMADTASYRHELIKPDNEKYAPAITRKLVGTAQQP